MSSREKGPVVLFGRAHNIAKNQLGMWLPLVMRRPHEASAHLDHFDDLHRTLDLCEADPRATSGLFRLARALAPSAAAMPWSGMHCVHAGLTRIERVTPAAAAETATIASVLTGAAVPLHLVATSSRRRNGCGTGSSDGSSDGCDGGEGACDCGCPSDPAILFITRVGHHDAVAVLPNHEVGLLGSRAAGTLG